MKFLVPKIILILILLTLIYFGIVVNIFNDPILSKNEFGDYIGGVLNPLLALLSTISIIYLTYVIAKAENSKAEESIITQKRITLNQMRNEALNMLDNRLNLFINEIGHLNITNQDENNFIKRVLANQIKRERESKNEKKNRSFWLIILFWIIRSKLTPTHQYKRFRLKGCSEHFLV